MLKNWPCSGLIDTLVGGVRRVENDIAIDGDIEPIPSRYFDRRLNVQLPTEGLSSQLGQLPAHGTTDNLAVAGHRQNRSVPILRELDSSAEQAGQDSKTQQPSIMVVHGISEARSASGVLTDHPI